MRIHHGGWHAAFLFTWFVSVSAVAQQGVAVAATDAADRASTGGGDIDTVVVTGRDERSYTVDSSAAATRLPLSLRDTPQSLTVVTRERLDDQNLHTVRDVLDHTPGVYSYQYDTERVLFTARGFTIDNLMYDGVPATTNSNTGSVEDALDLAFYERIEIVRGATGLTTGAGSPAASVNLVRKHADSRHAAVDFAFTQASWNDSRLDADVAVPLTNDGRIRARVVGAYQNRESYQDVYSNEKKVFYGVVDADLTERARLSVGYDYQNSMPQGNTWGSFPLYFSDGTPTNWPTSVTTAADWSFWNRRYETAFADLNYKFDGDWVLRSTLSWNRYTQSSQLFYVYGFPDADSGVVAVDPDNGYGGYAYADRAKVIQRSLDVYASGPFSLFGREHELVVGYNGSRVANNSVKASPLEAIDGGVLPWPVDMFHWNGTYPEPTFGEYTTSNDLTTTQNGLYLATRISILDPLKLVAGARYATWKIDSFSVYDTLNDSRYDYEQTIPYAGLVYDVMQQFSLFTSYTEIFKPQNARDINGHYLDPIDGKSYEVGIKGEHFGGKLNTALTLFRTLQDNVAAPIYNDDGSPAEFPDGSAKNRAIDGTVSRGFELELAGELTQGWNASLGWTHYLIDDADGHAVRTFVPRTLVRLYTTWNPRGALKRLTLGGGVDWQSDSSTQVGSPDGGATLHQGDVTLLGLMVRWQFTPQWSLQLNGENLLDKKYYVLDEYDNTYYGAPISGSASLRFRF
ncbi:TonB-dependent siderophore receptor [Solimonas soli]|uniref:TonB-dependent siderophore receptor n=1 Tax=Solimonas soli TaxID=413479 RepID=UPI0004AFA64A|nr:TonB-dependent siderophore receptor [Solimonas soli]